MTTDTPKVTTTAPGQLLGYTLQFPRALCRLLQVGVGGAVGIEVMGDVSAYLDNGTIVNEEDKSSTTGNPLTDRSTDLWKTFHNWIRQIANGTIDLPKTQFVIYTNSRGRPALVDTFAAAKTSESAKAAIQKAIAELKDTSHDHDIWPYYDYVVNQNAAIFEQLLAKFELIVGVDSAHTDVKRELEGKFIQRAALATVSNEICGWFQQTVVDKLAARQPAIVTFDDLKHHVAVLLSRVRQRELIDFAAAELTIADKIDPSLQRRPVFVKQLDLIKLSDERKIEAVTDYLRANYNRQRWIDNETLDETTARDFEARLHSFWQTKQRTTELIYASMAEEKRGELLLGECTTRQELIRGEAPPDRTIAGTYHALADSKKLGWHPQWSKSLRQQETRNG